MALFALLAARLMAAIGARAAVSLALFVVVVAGAARAAAPDFVSLVALTAAFGVGAGLAGALFPAIVKESVPRAPALATSVYAIGINGAAGVAAAVAVPLGSVTGSWRGAFAAFAIAGAVSLVVWLVLMGGAGAKRQAAVSVVRLPWQRRDAWWLAVIFGLQGLCFFGLNAWLAASYIERGWDAASAGGLVGLLNLVTLPATVLFGLIGDRTSRRRYLVAASLLLTVSIAGSAVAPSVAWLWTAGAGIACGSLFPLAMALSVEVGSSSHDASAVAGLMLGLGYLMAGSAPILLGAARDVTGSFTAGLWLLVLLAVVLVGMCATFRAGEGEAA